MKFINTALWVRSLVLVSLLAGSSCSALPNLSSLLTPSPGTPSSGEGQTVSPVLATSTPGGETPTGGEQSNTPVGTSLPIQSTPPSEPSAPSRPQPPETLVTFQVQLPADTPPEAAVYLTILDEVTGLALNTRSHLMEPAAEQADGELPVFTITLPYALGSTVQYRYEREASGFTVSEHVSNGAAVRYRLYYVQGPGAIQDVVSRWTDTPFSGPTGRIQGQATDLATGQPIPSLLITAGGAQTLTTADGSFLVEGLPPGVHNLVALALDGSYRTFQQGAEVAAESTTPAPIQLAAAPKVQVTFTARLPEETPPIIPVRLAGSLYQLGNTFADLRGGINTITPNMPVLERLTDGLYTLTMELYAGSDVRYKYTLGDGFWNAEHSSNGEFRLRQLIVPETDLQIEDTVDTWRSGLQGPVTFDLTAPASTPLGDTVSIQFNPLFGWTEPLPMWALGPDRWAYVLFSPLNLPGELGYRYCRNGQCGTADDAATPGEMTSGRPFTISNQAQTFVETVESWALAGTAVEPVIPSVPVTIRDERFMAGVELRPGYHPSWRALLPNLLGDVEAVKANWLVMAPTWTFTRSAPPVLEPVAGQDALWPDLIVAAEQARTRKMNVALFPTPRFQVDPAAWWTDAPRDFSWWLVWFNQYRIFLLHHAGLAEQAGNGALVLGGDWLAPALPAGLLPDGSPSGVPTDAEARWRGLIAEIRSRFSGQLLWALPYEAADEVPPFIDIMDGIYLLYSPPLSAQPDAPAADLEAEAGRSLDNVVMPLRFLYDKPLILAVAYPSAQGGANGCVPASTDSCLDLDVLPPSDPTLASIPVDLQEQVDVYTALLGAVNSRDWIGGFVSRGYYPPASLQDRSSSIHGKPAAGVLAGWFQGFLSEPEVQAP